MRQSWLLLASCPDHIIKELSLIIALVSSNLAKEFDHRNSFLPEKKNFSKMLDLLDINSQECHTFVENFSNIVEHSPLIAGTLWSLKPFKSVDHFVLETMKIINSMPESST
jgi:hypothetical protein